jgi:hypothetical protein
MVAAFWRWRWDQIPSKSAVSIGAAVVPAIATAATSFAAIQIATELAQAGLLAAGAIEVDDTSGRYGDADHGGTMLVSGDRRRGPRLRGPLINVL